MTQDILVLGATGAVGSRLLNELLARGEQVRAASRRPITDNRPSLRWVQFDLEDPRTFAAALAGVKKVFLIARPGDDQPQKLALPLIEQMKASKVQQVVDLSAIGVEGFPEFGLRQVELALEESGLGFTHLRPNWFMQIFSSAPLLNEILATGSFSLPTGDVRISYIHAQDIASAAAAALTEAAHLNQAYSLTGPQALDHSQIAERLSEASGASIQYLASSEQQAAQKLSAAGFSQQRVERLLGFYRLVRAGLSSPVSRDLENLIGRPGLSFEDFARQEAHVWQRRVERT